MHFNKAQHNNQSLSHLVNTADPRILAYSICHLNESKPVNCRYLIIDEKNIFFVENGTIIEQWVINRISYDSNGGEITTTEGNIILISKDILIRRINSEDVHFKYIPIDIDLVNIKTEYLKNK